MSDKRYLFGDPEDWGDREKQFCGHIILALDAVKAGKDAEVEIGGQSFSPFAVWDALFGEETVGAQQVFEALETAR